MKILYSRSTNRAIYYYGSGCTTSIVDEQYHAVAHIHHAPIDLRTMSQSFSNSEINDWEEKEI